MKKKTLVFVLLSLLLPLAGCGETDSPLPTSSEPTSSEPTPEKEKTIQEILSEQSGFYDIRSDIKIQKDSKQYYSFLGRETLYLGTSDGTDGKIRYSFGIRERMSNLDKNTDTTQETYTIYRTPGQTFTLNPSSGKYSVKEEENTGFTPFVLGYDFTKASDVSTVDKGGKSEVTGKVASASLKGFFGKDTLTGVSDFAFTASLDADKVLTSLIFTYTQDGYSVRQRKTYSTINSPLTTPKVS